MPLALLITAWIALPFSLWLVLKPKTAYALPVIAIIISITLLAIAQWMQTDSTVVLLSSDKNGVARSTTYVFSRGHYLQDLSLNYLIVTALAALIAKFGQNLTLRMIPLGFWMNHLGCMAIALQPVIAAAYMPHRYVDYPVWFAWTNRINFTGTMLSYLGIGFLVLLTLSALIQTLTQCKT